MFFFDDEKPAGAQALVETYRRLVPDADVDIGRAPARFSWRGSFIDVGSRALFRLRCSSGWQVRSRFEKKSFCISLPAQGAIQGTIRGREHTALPGQAMVSAVPQISRVAVLSDEGHIRSVLKWDLREVERTLASLLEGVAVDDLELEPVLDMSTLDGQMLKGLLDALALGLRHPKSHSPLTTDLMSEAVLRLIFERFPHRFSERLARQKHMIVPRHVRRAVDFMQAHRGEALRIADIAAVCQVSARALEEGFKIFKGTTPSAYLRRLRLEAVHEELKAGGGEKRTVADIALKWGFVSMGRFSHQYQAAFGERPSETLRRR